MSLPDQQKLAEIESCLGQLLETIEQHELWTPPNPNKTLYFTWDFINRSKVMLSDVENIKNGRPLQHADQFRPAPGTGNAAALKVYNDIAGRCFLTKMLVTDTTGKTAMMTGQTGRPVDFGAAAKAKVEELNRIISAGE